LGGIGFTVSLLIADLGFTNELMGDEARLGVLIASAAAGILGFLFFWLSSSPQHEPRAAPVPSG
jgi:NhaA family Na+:H+ antiporter